LLSSPVPTYSECLKLPYLDAVICESLRLSPSVGGVFTRVVPTGGAEVLAGQMALGGTTVGVNNYVLGRDEEIYGSNAETFKPERWLDEMNRKKFREYDFAFGHGARV
jgi:cytochrome P450